MNRISQLTQGGNPVGSKRLDFEYNADNQISGISRFDDLIGGTASLVLQTDNSYDGIGRLVGMTHSNNAATIVDYDFTFDDASRLTQFNSSVDGASDPCGACYIEDKAKRIFQLQDDPENCFIRRWGQWVPVAGDRSGEGNGLN